MCRKELFLTLFIIGVAVGYDLGIVNKYSYETLTTVDEQCQADAEEQIVGQKLKAKVDVLAVWQNPDVPTQQLLKIKVYDVNLQVPKKGILTNHASDLDKISTKETFILREDGAVTQLWEDPAENYVIRNIKKGIASLLHIRKKNQHIKEVDVAGNCQTIYDVQGKNVQKRKSHCIHSQFNGTLSQPYGVRSSTAQHLLSTDCKLSNEKSDIISQCTATENIKAYSNVWKTASICVNAKSKMSLETTFKEKHSFSHKNVQSVIDELQKIFGNLEVGDLEADVIKKEPVPQSKLVDILKRYQDSLKNENLAKLKSALAFYKVLPYFRMASKEEISKILKYKGLHTNEKGVLKPIRDQLMDLIAATPHKESLQAVWEHFKDTKDYDERLERFLISLSVTPKPTEDILKQIKMFLLNGKHHEKIETTLIATFGALVKTYSEHYEIVKDEVLREAVSFLTNKLESCTSEACMQAYLRGLRNAASPLSLRLLLRHALKGGKQALEAVLAVRNIDVRLIPTEVQNELCKVFLQVKQKQDRSTRSVAADILLDLDPSVEVLNEILEELTDQSDPEFSTSVAAKIIQKCAQNKKLRADIYNLLSETDLAHFYSLAQKGSSSLFRKPLVNSQGINVTYGIEMEMLPGNLLKRSVFDVSFDQLEVSNLLTVTMFAEGLGSLAGGSSDDNAPPQAGMELTLMGSTLRPYIFFTGTSELMGHAWSGTASTPTPALQGIFSFSDDEKVIVLHNGLIAHVQLRGVLSTDLSASIQISLWNQNSQSQVKNAAALLMRGSVTVDSGFSTVQGAFQFSGQSAIDFSTNLVFSESPFQMCLQMEHPDILVKQDTHRSMSLAGSTYTYKKSKKRERTIPRKSYALNERNNEQCRQLN